MRYSAFLALMVLILTACIRATPATPMAIFTPVPSSTLAIPPFTQIGQLDGHTGAVNSLQWSVDGSKLVSGGGDGRFILWDMPTKKALLKVKTANPIWVVSLSPDASRVAVAGYGGAKVYETQTGEKLFDLPGSSHRVYAIAWSPDGTQIAAGFSDGQVIVFDSQSAEAARQWPGHVSGGISTEVIGIAWSPDGKRIASGGLDYAVRFWDPSGGGEGAVLRADTRQRNDINGIAWSPDGHLLAAAGQDGVARIWDVASGQEKMTLGEAGSAWVRGVAWSPDGRSLAICGADRLVHVWEIASGDIIATLTGHTAPAWSVAWSPDGKIIASGSGNYEVTGGDTGIRLYSAP